MPDRPMTFDEFRDHLASILEVPREWLGEDVSFVEDLAFDSLRMLGLGMLFEDLGVEMPTELAWDIRTISEAYAYYVQQTSQRESTRPA